MSNILKQNTGNPISKRAITIFLMVIIAAPIGYISISAFIRSTHLGSFGDMSGTPNYNNTLYMTPILENFTRDPDIDMAEIELIKDSIGPSGSYYKVGFSVSCWYSATLAFNGTDWNFDPDDLYYKLNMSADTNTPILFHMNGGNWGACGVNNLFLQNLWEDDNEVQWDQFDNTPTANYGEGCLKNRLFSLQKDTEFNRYREIHLKQAARIINQFSIDYPDLFVGCSLDSEIHIDPGENQGGVWLYYDYNPLMIAEYREWLEDRYTLSEYNTKFGQSVASFALIDAPRTAILGNPLWEEWVLFRQHIVQQCVEMQCKWLFECGIAKNKIFSHQILSEPGNIEAYYGRCDLLSTAVSDYGVVGVTRYNYIDPEIFWGINAISGSDWGLFEWNIWKERSPSDYYVYLMQLKAMYQAGIHVVCPNGWWELTNHDLMIRNNTVFIQALHDFAVLVGEYPRTTAPEGRLSFIDYLYVDVKTISAFLDRNVELLLVPFGCSLIGVIVVSIVKKFKSRS
jgi:hypothetical protein